MTKERRAGWCRRTADRDDARMALFVIEVSPYLKSRGPGRALRRRQPPRRPVYRPAGRRDARKGKAAGIATSREVVKW